MHEKWPEALAAALIALPAAVSAGEPLSGAEFEAYAEGHTLTYVEDGKPFGTEQYLPGRKVKWAFAGGACIDGWWYEASPGLICFVYETEVGDQCWHFRLEASGLSAEFVDAEGTGTMLYEAQRSTRPLLCPGPDVGV